MDYETRKRRRKKADTGGHSEEIRFRYIPEELVLNILPRLPTKSVGRFRCVSKQWCRWVSDIRRSKVLVRKEKQKGFSQKTHVSFFSMDENMKMETICTSLADDSDYETNVSLDSFSKINDLSKHNLSHLAQDDDNLYSISYYWCPAPSTPKMHAIKGRIMGSCNGLVLINMYNDLFLWNPSTGHHKKVLSHHRLSDTESGDVVSGLCFDSNKGEFKVLMAFTHCKHAVMVGSLKSKMWTHIDFPFGIDTIRTGPVLNDRLHWLTRRHIVYFDPKMDKFVDFPMPEIRDYGRYIGASLCVFDGCLCMVCHMYDSYNNCIGNFFVMREYGVKESWAVLFKIELANVDYLYPNSEPLFYKEDKEMIIMKGYGWKRSGISAFDRNGRFCFDVMVSHRDYEGTMTMIVYEETFVLENLLVTSSSVSST